MKEIRLLAALAALILAGTSCKKILGIPPANSDKPIPTVLNAVYVLECKFKDSTGFPGIFVTDSLSLRVTIHDTIVTVSDIRILLQKHGLKR